MLQAARLLSGIEPEATVVWTVRVGVGGVEGPVQQETADHVALLARPAWRAAAVFPQFHIAQNPRLHRKFATQVDNHDLNYRDEVCSACSGIPSQQARASKFELCHLQNVKIRTAN